MKDFYGCPTQVMYWDEGAGTYMAGIAYRDEVICAMDSSVDKISNLVEYIKDSKYKQFDAIYEYHNWEDITANLCGGRLPNGCPAGRIK